MTATNTQKTEILIVPSGGEFEIVKLVDNVPEHIGWSLDRKSAERIAKAAL